MNLDEKIGRRVKLRDLHILTTVAEAGSMARAAAGLGVTQPSVSYAIAGLEHALGVPLLDRTPQGVTPTAYGRALIDRSVGAFNELRQGIADIEFLSDPGRGELWLGTTPPMSAIAAQVIKRLTSLHPRMTFHLLTDTTTILTRHLRERSIELAISRMVEPLSGDRLNAERLFDDQLVVMAGKDSQWLSHRRIQLSELLGELWVLPPPSSFLGALIGQLFRAHRLDQPRAAVDTASTYAITILVSTGPFMTIQPQTMLSVPRKHPSLAALPVDLKPARNPVALLTLKDRAPSPAAKLFIDTARSLFRKGRNGAFE